VLRTPKKRETKVRKEVKRKVQTPKSRSTFFIGRKRRLHAVKKSLYLDRNGRLQMFSPEIYEVIKKTRMFLKKPIIDHNTMIYGYEINNFNLYKKNGYKYNNRWNNKEFVDYELYNTLIVLSQSVSTKLNRIIPQNKFDALLSLAFDLPTEIFRDCMVLRYCEIGEFEKAALHIKHWEHLKQKKVKKSSHKRRRKIDFNIFTKADYTIIK